MSDEVIDIESDQMTPYLRDELASTIQDAKNLAPARTIGLAVKAGMDNWEFSTLPLDLPTLARVSQLIRIRKGPSIKLDTLIGKRVAVKHVVVHPAYKEQDDGEMTLFPRILLVSANGEVVRCGSITLLQSINELAMMLGRKMPFDPELVIIPQHTITDKGHRMYYVEPAE